MAISLSIILLQFVPSLCGSPQAETTDTKSGVHVINLRQIAIGMPVGGSLEGAANEAFAGPLTAR
jgi:hypothetical protein